MKSGPTSATPRTDSGSEAESSGLARKAHKPKKAHKAKKASVAAASAPAPHGYQDPCKVNADLAQCNETKRK
jgi:hypothetical protein